MRLNPSVIEIMFTCGQLPAGFGKPMCFQMLLFLLILCRRSVWLGGSTSDLAGGGLHVGYKANRKRHTPDCMTTRTLFAPSPLWMCVLIGDNWVHVQNSESQVLSVPIEAKKLLHLLFYTVISFLHTLCCDFHTLSRLDAVLNVWSQQQIGSALKVFNINKNHAFIWVPHVRNLITNQTNVTTSSWLSAVLDIMLQSELLDSSRLHYSWRSQQPNWKYHCRWVVFTLSTMWPARCVWHDTPQDRAYSGTMFLCVWG